MLNTLKQLIPLPLLNSVRRFRTRWAYRDYRHMSRQQVFQHIYKNGVWGAAAGENGFYSGTGSHDASVVQPYVSAVGAWLSQLPHKPTALDLGCGDFSVGSQLRTHCGAYTACDIVPELIESHRKNHAALAVDFRCLDLANDPLPDAEVIFVRQVLQHLDNHSIAQFCKQLAGRHAYLVVTEHIPRNAQFVANKDKPSGPDTRIGYNSGVILTQAPFSLRIKNQTVLCEVPENGGVIQTLVYQLS
jgi:2-polyprenyl-3-methyl-5-hydroxy-6-metoxy-1,4-benzoquinol methylase